MSKKKNDEHVATVEKEQAAGDEGDGKDGRKTGKVCFLLYVNEVFQQMMYTWARRPSRGTSGY